MAKPDCDDGWLPYAHELDAALAVADFTKGARIVLREVFAQIYGLAKRKHAELSPTEIGGRIGMARSHVMRGITELVGSGVLIRRPDGLYRFIKDYESWTYKGAPRLSPMEVCYCKHAPKTASSYIHPQKQNLLPNEVTHQQSHVTSLGNETGGLLPNEVTDVTQRGNGLLPNEVTNSPSPYRNARGIENGELIELPACLPAGEEDKTEVTEIGLVGVIEAARACFGEFAADMVVKVAKEIHNEFGGRYEFYAAAIRQVSREQSGPGAKPVRNLHRLCMTIARSFAKNGISPEPVALIPATPHKQTPAERRKAQSEAIHLAASQLDPDEET
jgi:hypothetical protein